LQRRFDELGLTDEEGAEGDEAGAADDEVIIGSGAKETSGAQPRAATGLGLMATAEARPEPASRTATPLSFILF